jgi:pimeloyl-ACP methyl ester carboxylesterase
VVPDAGHYPHVEFPDAVGAAIDEFLAATNP